MAFKDIAYEPHPVSIERKKELNGQGFKVLDVRFAPISDVSAKADESNRADLEARAALLGVEFRANIGDETLLARVTEARAKMDVEAGQLGIADAEGMSDADILAAIEKATAPNV